MSVPGILTVLFAIGTFGDNGVYPVLIGLALLVQGLVVYAFFGALAFVVEDLVAIRTMMLESLQNNSK